jgi:hypothetical protein
VKRNHPLRENALMMMSDLGLTGNRALTLEQKRKIFVLFFSLSMGRSLFWLFILHLHCMHNILNV